MSRPAAYDPQEGYKFQIFCRFDTPTWEHCDYATNRAEASHLIQEYQMAYTPGYEFKAVMLPKRYWPKE